MSANPSDNVDAEESWTADARVQRSRRRIIQATVDLIVERGASAVTVDAISERSGVAKSTLYRHWSSIDALVLDVYRGAIPKTVDPDPDMAFEDALRQQVASVAEVLTDPEWVRLLPDLVSMRTQFPEIGDLADRDEERKRAALASVLATGAAQGLVPDGLDVATVAPVLLGPMVMCALFGEAERIEEVGAFAVERFLDSYRT